MFKTSLVSNPSSGLIEVDSFSGPILQKICISDRGCLVGGLLHIFSNGMEIQYLKKMDFSGPDILQPIPSSNMLLQTEFNKFSQAIIMDPCQRSLAFTHAKLFR